MITLLSRELDGLLPLKAPALLDSSSQARLQWVFPLRLPLLHFHSGHRRRIPLLCRCPTHLATFRTRSILLARSKWDWPGDSPAPLRDWTSFWQRLRSRLLVRLILFLPQKSQRLLLVSARVGPFPQIIRCQTAPLSGWTVQVKLFLWFRRHLHPYQVH